jgi:hypothetical protein
MSLKEITDHIYGRANVITRTDRPNMFTKELNIYIDYLKNKMEETKLSMTKKQEQYYQTFEANLKEGIIYYKHMFSSLKDKFAGSKASILNELDESLKALNLVMEKKM